MTDIFFLMNACISLYFFTAHLKTEKPKTFILGIFFHDCCRSFKTGRYGHSLVLFTGLLWKKHSFKASNLYLLACVEYIMLFTILLFVLYP